MIRAKAERVAVAGEARGEVAVLTEPLSFWGGFDAETARVIDVHHPQHGLRLNAKVVVMESGRGSSSASSVLAEAARLGMSPAGFVVRTSDEILSTGAIVADELYRRPLPIVEVDAETFAACVEAATITIGANGELLIE